MKLKHLKITLGLALLLPTTMVTAADVALDYDFYKARIEPIFLKKRPTHGRCYVCHSANNSALRLERLSPGSNGWSEDQSEKNFRRVTALVVAGEPEKSKLLLQPLAPEAGGLAFHSGGRQFASKDDPDWKILAQWVRGESK